MRDLVWVGSSLKDLKAFPAPVQDVMGRALLDVQFGDTPHGAKALKGFRGATVMEIVDDHDRSTYRTVYTAQFSDIVYVLNCFQKKSKSGIATPKKELELVKQRLKAVLTDRNPTP
jgi:phage-related protein